MKTELVTTLKRKATEMISGLRDEKESILITQNGIPAAYLVDVDIYREMTRRISILEGIALGEGAVASGRTFSQAQAKKRLAKWLK